MAMLAIKMCFSKLRKNSKKLEETEMEEIAPIDATTNATTNVTNEATLRKEWHSNIQEVLILEEALDVEKHTYNTFVENMKYKMNQKQHYESNLAQLKTAMLASLREPHLDVSAFMNLLNEHVNAQQGFDASACRLYEMQQEFNKHYHSWDSKTEQKINKIKAMHERIKYIADTLNISCDWNTLKKEKIDCVALEN
jgi:hypothetical protein